MELPYVKNKMVFCQGIFPGQPPHLSSPNGEWVKDLTADGDVEANPGPPKIQVMLPPLILTHINVLLLTRAAHTLGDAQLLPHYLHTLTTSISQLTNFPPTIGAFV